MRMLSAWIVSGAIAALVCLSLPQTSNAYVFYIDVCPTTKKVGDTWTMRYLCWKCDCTNGGMFCDDCPHVPGPYIKGNHSMDYPSCCDVTAPRKMINGNDIIG